VAAPIRLRSNFRAVVVDERRVVVYSEATHRLFDGAVYIDLISLLGCGYGKAELAAELSSRHARELVYFALGRLETLGLTTTAPTGPSAPFVDSLRAAPQLYDSAKAALAVEVRSLGQAQPHQRDLESALSEKRFTVDAESSNFVVIATEDYLHPDLAPAVEALERAGTPWLLLKPLGQLLWIGPLISSDSEFDRELFFRRLRENRYIPYHPDPAFPLASAGCQLAWQFAILELEKYAASAPSDSRESLLTLDIASLDLQLHPLPKRHAQPAQQTWQFQPSARTCHHDGGYRTRPVQETVAELERHVSPVTGIINRVIRADGVPGHVYYAWYSTPLEPWETGFRMTSSSAGKGSSDSQSKASCLAEAIERYSSYFQGHEPVRLASTAAMADESAEPVHLLQHFSEAQYRNRLEINARGSDAHAVPLPLDPDREIAWTANWNLTRNRPVWLPTAYCYYRYPDSDYCRADSNGCASGNTIEEAILQGLLELVERDAVAIWWYNRLPRPGIDLDSFSNRFLSQTKRFYEQNDLKLEVLDVTSDLGIPVVVAISALGDGSDVYVGMGAHLDIELAVSRAITEVLQQGMPGAPSPEETIPNSFSFKRRRLARTSLSDHPHMLPQPGPLKTDRDYERRESADLVADIEYARGLAEQAGLEVLALDLTRPETGFPTVRVTVPGLRHYWARLGPGRLYHAPVKMGCLPRPNREDEINPVPWLG